nr:FAD-binding protein [candidate division KSB1 bacterium]
MEDIVQELRKHINGEVRFDRYSRILYSTDASIYEIEPLGVVIPKTAEDVQATVELADNHGIPIVPRGGGTSLVGQSIGAGIVIDFSKYMHQVLEVNAEEKWARIQPGVVLDQLNTHIRNFNLFFGPDTATSSRANLGGLIGNNSSGARSIYYGKTINHVLELKVLLANGEEAVLKPLDEKALTTKVKEPGLQGSVYRAVRETATANKDEIDKRYPKILRRVGGYNLDEFVNDQPFNLAKMIVGSEGTLA